MNNIIILSLLVYFTQGLEGLPAQSFNFYLKNLGWNESKLMLVGSLITVAWLIKPVLGYYIDRKLNKKTWIWLSLLGSILMASTIGLFTLPMALILILMTLASTNTAIRDIAVDGLSVEIGTQTETNNQIQASQWIAITVASCLVGVGGGYIADHFTYKTAFLCLLPLYIILIYFINNNKIHSNKINNIENYNYKVLLKNKHFWYACLFLFLYKYSPSFGTPLYFIEVNKFKWSQTFIGTMGTVSAIVSITGACVFYKFAKYIDKKKWLIGSIFASALTSLCYLYFTPTTDVIFNIVFSFIGMIIFLIVMSWMADNCIKGMESTSFAILCAISNLANTCSLLSGGFLFDKIGLTGLILLSSVTSFSCLLFINKVFDVKLTPNTKE